MNEMPTSLSSALGRINKYDGTPRRKEREREIYRDEGRKKERERRNGGAIFIRDTFYEQNGRAHVHTDIVEIMAPDLSHAYKFQNISGPMKKR